MEIIKKNMVGIVLLGVVLIIWIGLLVISDKVFSEVDPNTATYTKPLQQNFDLTTLKKVTERTESSFPVLPSEFFSLETN